MVKVEMQHDKEKGIITLFFETNKEEELDVIDAVRVAVMSNLSKRYSYETSGRLAIQIKEEVTIP